MVNWAGLATPTNRVFSGPELPVPVLVSVKATAGLAWPATTAPKSYGFGVRLSTGTSATPVPERSTEALTVGVETNRIAARLPATRGVKPTCSVQLACG